MCLIWKWTHADAIYLHFGSQRANIARALGKNLYRASCDHTKVIKSFVCILISSSSSITISQERERASKEIKMRQLVIYSSMILLVVVVVACATIEATMFSEQIIRIRSTEQIQASSATASRDEMNGAEMNGQDDDESSTTSGISTEGVRQQQQHQHQQPHVQVAASQPIRLPKINIYASENEVKKLLGE